MFEPRTSREARGWAEWWRRWSRECSLQPRYTTIVTTPIADLTHVWMATARPPPPEHLTKRVKRLEEAYASASKCLTQVPTATLLEAAEALHTANLAAHAVVEQRLEEFGYERPVEEVPATPQAEAAWLAMNEEVSPPAEPAGSCSHRFTTYPSCIVAQSR